MKTSSRKTSLRHYAATLMTAFCLLSTLQAQAAVVNVATVPLATAGTLLVNPNLMFIMDNSGSMDWQHMPDDASDGGSSVPFRFGYYGLRSSQCNQVYYDPNTVYLPPVDAAGIPYNDAVFTKAAADGYTTNCATNPTSCVDLSTNFKASTDLLGDTTGQPAYYYQYNGTQTSGQQKNYNDPGNAFSTECGDSAGSIDPATGKLYKVAPSSSVGGTFTKVTIGSSNSYDIVFTGLGSLTVSNIMVNGVNLNATQSATGVDGASVAANIASVLATTGVAAANGYVVTASGSTVTIQYPASVKAPTAPTFTTSGTGTITYTITAAGSASTQLTNFANWYSYYRTRLLMMKTASGRAFAALSDKYRVGYMSLNTNSDFLNVAPFDSVQKGLWFGKLYGEVTNGSTPLRRTLANAGLYYAHKLTLGSNVVVNDPIEYSCQQNFTILSTDGFWNGNTPYQVDGVTPVGNQDGTAPRPMYDSASSAPTTTVTYSQNYYKAISGNCAKGRQILEITPHTYTCTSTLINGIPGTETCGPHSLGTPYTSGMCTKQLSLPNPSPGPRTQIGSAIGGTGATGGSSDSLADVAMYYYQTDLRTVDLGNCGGFAPPGGTQQDVCANDVFRTDTDNNTAQHMTTFTLGLGASGRSVFAELSYRH